MYIVYGIPNCDKIKKIKKNLDRQNIKYELYNYKKQEPTIAFIKKCQEKLGSLPINKRGTTFRKIKDEFEAASIGGKIELMIANPSCLIRPIIEKNKEIISLGEVEV